MSNQLVLENLRLRELRIVVEQNKAFFEEFIRVLKTCGYPSLFAFINEPDDAKALAFLKWYFSHAFKSNLCDGVGTPYLESKAKWYFLSWVLRDAPAQRLEPMLSCVAGSNRTEKQSNLLNHIRKDVAPLFPDQHSWEWPCVSEVMLARLEGSRRALKGGLFENMVRALLADLFKKHSLSLVIAEKEVRLDDETYDIQITGKRGKLLIPVKTRETMGGGHALLFTRDIHKSITVAKNAGNECLPLIIAESWSGDLKSLPCSQFIYIQINPNQLAQIRDLLATELEAQVATFQALA